jgi:nucleotide-binding universal stress UspA family protein
MTYKHILVPVDGSELTDKAIRCSLELTKQLGATVVAYVAEPFAPMPTGPRPRAAMERDAKAHDEAVRAHARPVLARFEQAARQAGVPFEGVFDQVGQVDKAIIAAAESHGCDMVVMVTHGRGAFGEFLFGSQTKAMLAGCSLPLLVLH